MPGNLLLISIAFVGLLLVSSSQVYAQDERDLHTDVSKDKNFDFILRLGQGGFRDNRSPLGKLGGGQMTLDVRPSGQAFGLSFSSEYYTNSPDATHSYEIPDLFSINMFYMSQLFNIERVKYFYSAGFGWLNVPKDDTDTTVRGSHLNLEAGINVRAFWKIGFYGVAKYLRAQKKENNVKVIDFNEGIILLGITYSFSL